MSITFNRKWAGAPPPNILQYAYDAQGNKDKKFGTVCGIRNKLCGVGSTWAYEEVRHADCTGKCTCGTGGGVRPKLWPSAIGKICDSKVGFLESKTVRNVVSTCLPR
jgi:hypothetical protein